MLRWSRVGRLGSRRRVRPVVPTTARTSKMAARVDQVAAVSRATQPAWRRLSSKDAERKLHSATLSPKVREGSNNAVVEAMRSVPDEYRAPLVVVAGSQAVLNFGFGVIVPVLPVYAATTLGMGATGVGVVLAVPALARVALNSTAGRLSDKIGRQPMMSLGEMTAAVGIACTGLSGGLAEMVCARAVLGAGGAAATAGSSAWTADLTSLPTVRPHRGVVMGAMGALVSASWVTGPAVGGVLCDAAGCTAMFTGTAAMAAACSLAYSFLVPDIPRDRVRDDDGSEVQQEQDTSALLADPAQRAAVVANAALAANYAVALSVLPLQYNALADATPLEIGCLFSAMAGLGIFGGPICGAVSDKLGRLAVVGPGLVLCGLGDLGMALAPDANVFVAAALLLGAGEAVAAPAIAALAADAAPADRRSEALALSRTATDLVFVALPPTMGLAADAIGGHAPLAAVGFGTGLCALYVTRPPRLFR